MTQAQLIRHVAGRTGESAGTVRRRGFHLQAARPEDQQPADLRLVVNCPSCRRPVPYPGRAGDGSPALAECADPRCDLLFDFDPARVYATHTQGDRGHPAPGPA